MSALAAAVAPACEHTVDNARRRVDEALSALAAAMANLHGGQWTAHVDHEVGFVLVSPLKARAPPVG
jgi:hypothetical protein